MEDCHISVAVYYFAVIYSMAKSQVLFAKIEREKKVSKIDVDNFETRLIIITFLCNKKSLFMRMANWDNLERI